jgi:hypothetical protein
MGEREHLPRGGGALGRRTASAFCASPGSIAAGGLFRACSHANDEERDEGRAETYSIH